MKPLFFPLIIVFFLLQCTSKNTEQIVKLKGIPIDSISINTNLSTFRARPIKGKKFKEPIKKYPSDLEIEAVYQFPDLQRSYQIAAYTLNNPREKEKYLKEFGAAKLRFLELIKKVSPFDCTVSACMVKDSIGKEYFIFDRNNDEDFTNDLVLKFKESVTVQHGDSVRILQVHGNAQIDYFDGSKVRTKNIGLIFERRISAQGNKAYWMFDSIPFGMVKLERQKYQLILTHVTPYCDYYKFDFVGIDFNRDHKFEFLTDYFQQMYLPFTFGNTTYRITDIDPWGHHIKIKKCDPQKVPPIAVGLPAPDFVVTTTDSSQIHLHDFKGHYVLLGFWNCNSQYCLREIGRMLDFADDGLRIINFTFSENFDRYLSEDNKKSAKNLTIVRTDVLNPIRKLYQVGSENANILIDKQGKIVLIEKWTYDKINQKLNELFKL